MDKFDSAIDEIRSFYEDGVYPKAGQLGDIGRKYDIDTIAIVCYNEVERRRFLGAVDPSKPMDDPINLKENE